VRADAAVPHPDHPLPPENMSGHTKKLRFILEQLQRHLQHVGRPLTLLDFGCGNGSAVSRFLLGEADRFYGVDIHEPSRHFAHRHYGSERARFLDHVPPDVSFDVLVYSDVLEHLEHPAEPLRRHRDQLRDDGLLIGCVPNGYGPFENEKRLDRWFKLSAILDLPARLRRNLVKRPAPAPEPVDEEVAYNADSGHLQFFTRGELARTLDEAGFRLEEFRNGGFLGAPLSERYLFRGERVARWNSRIADRLPYWMVSTWLFTASKSPRPS